MRLKYKIYFLTALTCIAVLIFFYSSKNEEGNGLHWKAGAKAVYSMESRDVVQVTVPGAGMMHKRVFLKADLNMKIESVTEDNIRAAFQMYPVTVKFEGIRNPEAEKIFSGIFFADISPDGRFREFHYSNQIAPEDEKNIKECITDFQFIVKRSLFSSWTETERDSNGLYESEYSRKKNSLLKKKLSYPEADPENGLVPSVKHSEFNAEYDSSHVWIKNAKGRELLLFKSGKETVMKTSSRVKLRFITSDPVNSAEIWQGIKTSGDYISEWKSLKKNKTSLAVRTEKKKFRQKYGNPSIKGLCNILFKKYPGFKSASIKEIIKYLELYPETALELSDYLLNKKLNAKQRAVITHALARAGHEFAQKALVRIIEDDNFLEENRIQAAVGMAQLGKPCRNTITTLWDAYFRTTDDNEVQKNIGCTSVLSLGSIASTMDKSTETSEKNEAYDIKSKLRSELRSENDTKKKIALIHAAANTGDRDFTEPVSSFFESNDPNVRSAAASALSRIEDEDIDEILCNNYKTETNLSVKGVIITSLCNREATEDSIDLVRDNIAGEENDIVRGGMYRFLLKNRGKPGVRETLLEMKKTERVMEHRRMINRALYSTLNKKEADK